MKRLSSEFILSMGIPHYFRIITNEYKGVLMTNLTKNPDYFFIDFNGMIHTSANAMMREEVCDNPDEYIQNKTWDYLQECIVKIKPAQIVICADGVAPIAKMNQQRKRRYLSISENSTTSKWDRNAISPGTAFMSSFNAFMKNKVSDLSNYIYSGTDENAEGEHKIFERISKLSMDDKIIIYGLDADLIMLSLMSHHKNIILMRENTEEISSDFLYMNIDNLRSAILQDLSKTYKWPIDDNMSENDLIESYVVLCFLLGNDFLPHVPSLSLKKQGHSRILRAAKTVWENNDPLVVNGKINVSFLTQVLTILSKEENDIILKMNNEYGPDPLAKIIQKLPLKWRAYYYKNLFQCRLHDTTIIVESCKLFIKGIYWTYAYYKQMPKDNRWYYPYGYSPTVLDLANYFQSNTNIIEDIIVDEKNYFVSSDVQLLAILPPHSIELIPTELRKYMQNPSFGLAHMFPIEYPLQKYLKRHTWEYIPVLPALDVELIEKTLANKNKAATPP